MKRMVIRSGRTMMRMMLLRLIMTLMMVSIMITWMIIDDDDRLCTSFCDATFQPLNPGKVLTPQCWN